MVSMVDQMVDQNATYLTRRRGVHYYYTRRIPKELQKRPGKKRIVVSLKTKSRRMAVFSGNPGASPFHFICDCRRQLLQLTFV